jgi:hypothetical protein
MIDTGKYEPTQIDWMLHNTREHSPDGWRKLSKSLIELSNDDRLLIEYAPTLRAEVKRLREENHNRWVVIGELRQQIKELQDDLENWMAGEYQAGDD